MTVEPEQFDFFNMIELFGIKDRDAALQLVERATTQGGIHPGFGGRVTPAIQPPPEGEPKGALISDAFTMRSGLLTFIVEVDGRNTLDGASIYFSDGVQHRFQLDAISISENRSQGILHGTLNDTIAVSLYEPAFLSDRQWHGEDSDHDVVLYGVPYSIKIGTPPPIEVVDRIKDDGSKMPLNFEGAAIFMPMKDVPASLYSILGPVKRINPYELEVLAQKVWRVRVTIARIGDETDEDVDIDLFVPDTMWGEVGLPKEGDMIQANIRLCSRLWIANPVRAAIEGS
ncbi:MAG: hypothetical protein LCH61_10510 [Proteobacteria bacterium]|nr:hypothetical protein [Pseudomonadota bacterium]